MLPALPKSFQFKMFSSCLSISPFGVTSGKFVLIIAANVLVILAETTMGGIMRKEIFAYVAQPVLMVLTCVAIIGPISIHIFMISESLLKQKSDVKIWKEINEINKKIGANSVYLQKLFNIDFLLMTILPTVLYIAVILATFRTQPNWALGIICNLVSGVFYRWGILMFIYYMRYISDKLYLMGQEIEHLNELTRTYKFACNAAVERLYEMKNLLNMVWHLHGFVNTRYEVFLVFYVFLSLCGLTTATYFLGLRLIARNFSYAFESALCLIPYLYINAHISHVTSDFVLKVEKLFNALQLISDTNWNCPEVVSVVKSFKYQIISARLSTEVGGHLKVDYSNIILGVIFIVTTNIFMFLFLN